MLAKNTTRKLTLKDTFWGMAFDNESIYCNITFKLFASVFAFSSTFFNSDPIPKFIQLLYNTQPIQNRFYPINIYIYIL